MHLKIALALSLAAAALTLPRAAHAVIVSPPPDTRAFIQLYEDDSGQSSCAQLCVLVSGTGAPLTLAPITFAPHPPNFISASGRIDPFAIHASASTGAGVEYDLAFKDTYTVGGTATGPVAITITFSATGTASTVPGITFSGAVLHQLVFEAMKLTIGTFDVDAGSTPIPIVHPFDASTQVVQQQGTLSSFVQAITVPISASVSFTKMVSVGDVFDVGYELGLGLVRGAVDLNHTATISIGTPNGVFLSSALASAVPEPAPAMLLALGLAALGLQRRRGAQRRYSYSASLP